MNKGLEMKKQRKLGRDSFSDEMVAATVKSGMSRSLVAGKFGISRQTVYTIMKRVNLEAPLIASYKSNRSEISAWNQLKRQEKQVEILDTISRDDIEKADLKTKMVMLTTLGMDKSREYEMERVETNQSTGNVAMIVKHIFALKEQDRQKELEDNSG